MTALKSAAIDDGKWVPRWNQMDAARPWLSRSQPKVPGEYERLTALGVKIDYWTGVYWLAQMCYGSQLICANQTLMWRPLP